MNLEPGAPQASNMAKFARFSEVFSSIIRMRQTQAEIKSYSSTSFAEGIHFYSPPDDAQFLQFMIENSHAIAMFTFSISVSTAFKVHLNYHAMVLKRKEF